MYEVYRTNVFNKDIKRIKKRNKDVEKLIETMDQLISGKKLATKFRDHNLIGNYLGFRECHIEPNWLLVYQIKENTIVFARTGSHNDLF